MNYFIIHKKAIMSIHCNEAPVSKKLFFHLILCYLLEEEKKG